jgi:hypothetical protein
VKLIHLDYKIFWDFVGSIVIIVMVSLGTRDLVLFQWEILRKKNMGRNEVRGILLTCNDCGTLEKEVTTSKWA